MSYGNLTTPEWRLFLLSECIKVYNDAYENTALLRAGGKSAVASIKDVDTLSFNKLIRDVDCADIRAKLRSEWKFSGKVVDNGYRNYINCEYCQRQEIRYKYLCVNVHNNTWLSLGSVCVGRIIHGEDKMQDKDFSKKFISGLEAYKNTANATKSAAIPSEPVKQYDTYKANRLAQHQRMGEHTKYLRENGFGNNPFYQKMEKIWKDGYCLTEKQEAAIIRMATQHRNSATKEKANTQA